MVRIKKIVLRLIQGFFRVTRTGVVSGTMEDNDGFFHPQTRRHIDLVKFMTASGIPKDARILDVGCGDGTLAKRLRAANFRYIAGVDWLAADHVKSNSLDEYRQANLNDDGLKAFPSASFDCVVCSDVLEHLESPAFTLRELARVIKGGGDIFVTIPNAFNIFERFALLLTGNSTRYKTEEPGSFGHISMFPTQVMRSLCARAKLRLVATGQGYCMFAGAMVLPRATFGGLFSYVSYLHLRPIESRK